MLNGDCPHAKDLRMLRRLIIGIIKGIVVGGLLGFGLAKLGFVAPGAAMAYLGAAVAGVLVGLIAGKPIWAKDAKVEAGMKAFIGAALAAGLMFAARKWLTFSLPVALGPLSTANASLGETAAVGTLGGLAVTSMALVAAVLGGFYEADNTPDEPGAASSPSKLAKAKNQRIAAAGAVGELEEEPDAEQDKKRTKR
jgi:hypothetical protein